jgi:hypothetical protein
MKSLVDPVASKKTAQNRVCALAGAFTKGFFKDNCWQAPTQLFRSISAMGGEVEIQRTEYYSVGEIANMGKRWYLSVTANGFTFPAVLTASFSDAPNGEVYDLTFYTV